MENISFHNNIIQHIDPAEFLSGELAYEFTLYAPQLRTKQIENSVSVNGSTTTQIVGIQTRNYIVTSLRAYVNILSLAPVPPVIPELTDSDEAISAKNNENDMQFPAFAMDLIMKVGQVRAITGQFRLQNKRPGYFINLLRFITNQDYFYGGLETSLILRFRDIGEGLPQMDDGIYFYGDIEEIGYFAPINTPQDSNNTIALSGSVNAVLSGSLGSSNTPSPSPLPSSSFTFSLDSFDMPDELLVYFLPSYDSSQTVELSSATGQYSFSPFSGEVIDISSQLQSKGAGFYFFAAYRQSNPTAFDSSIYIKTRAIAPVESVSIGAANAIDSSKGVTYPVGLYVLEVLSLPTSISIQFEI